MVDDNLTVALLSAPCASILALIALTLCNTDLMINAFLDRCFSLCKMLIIVALHSVICVSILEYGC